MEDKTLNENNMKLLEQFFKAQMLLNRIHSQNFRASGAIGTPHRGQGRVLEMLTRHPEISQKEMGNLLDMRSQSLGEFLAKLERSGLITREPSPEDRRVMIIRLTEAGAVAAEQTAQKPEDANKLFGSLNDEEKAMLGELLSRLIDDFQKQLGDNEEPDLDFSDHFRGKEGFGDPQ